MIQTEQGQFFKHVFSAPTGRNHRRRCPTCHKSVIPFYDGTVHYAPDYEHSRGYRIESLRCDCGHIWPMYYDGSNEYA